MKIIKIMSLCLGGLLYVTSVKAEVLNVALTSSSVPFSYENEAGEWVGFNVDIAKAICEKIKASCTFHYLRFPEILPLVAEGKMDFALPNMLKTSERAAKVAFTVPYWRSTSSFVGPVDYNFSSAKRILEKDKICVIQNTRQMHFLQSVNEDKQDHLISTKSGTETIDALKKGACRFTLMPTMQSLSFLQSENGKGFGYLGKPISGHGLGGNVHIIVRKDRPALLKEIDAALQEMVHEGLHEQITRKYFPFSIL